MSGFGMVTVDDVLPEPAKVCGLDSLADRPFTDGTDALVVFSNAIWKNLPKKDD
jgi:hypothetical protein